MTGKIFFTCKLSLTSFQLLITNSISKRYVLLLTSLFLLLLLSKRFLSIHQQVCICLFFQAFVQTLSQVKKERVRFYKNSSSALSQRVGDVSCGLNSLQIEVSRVLRHVDSQICCCDSFTLSLDNGHFLFLLSFLYQILCLESFLLCDLFVFDSTSILFTKSQLGY